MQVQKNIYASTIENIYASSENIYASSENIYASSENIYASTFENIYVSSENIIAYVDVCRCRRIACIWEPIGGHGSILSLRI